MPLDPKDLYCIECRCREPKFCRICYGHDQWKEIPPPLKLSLHELSKGEIDWSSVH